MLDFQDIAATGVESDLLDRTTRVDLINWFAAHPDIAPSIGGPCDFSQAIRETAVFMFGEHGGVIFEWSAPGVYEAHIMLTRKGRGKWGVEASKEALRKLGAEKVWARIDPDNRALAVHASRCGFRRVDARTLYVEGMPRAYNIYEWRS